MLYATKKPKNIQIIVVNIDNLIAFQKETIVDFSVMIEKFVIVAVIPSNEVPSESTKVKNIITINGARANTASQIKYGIVK